MAFEFIQIPANGQGSAKEELNKLLRNGRIASVKKEFVSNGEDSFWAFCIEFLDGSLGVMERGRATTGPKIDYKEVLNEADFAVFARLRDLRKAVSDKEAIPAYSIFTNEQLAAMVTGKVDSLRKYFESIPHEHGTEPAVVPLAPVRSARQNRKVPARRW